MSGQYHRVAVYDPSRKQGRRAEVARWAARQGEPVDIDAVVAAHGVTRINAVKICSRLVRDGKLFRCAHGVYRPSLGGLLSEAYR